MQRPYIATEPFYHQAKSARISLLTQTDIIDEESFIEDVGSLLFLAFNDIVDDNRSNRKNPIPRYTCLLTFIVKPILSSTEAKGLQGFLKADVLPGKLYKQIKVRDLTIEMAKPGHLLDGYSPEKFTSDGYKIYSYVQGHGPEQIEEEAQCINLEKNGIEELPISPLDKEKFEIDSHFLEIPSTTVSGEALELNNKLTALENDNTAFQGQVQTLSAHVTSLQGAVIEKDMRIVELNGRVQSLSDENKRLGSQVESLQGDIKEKDSRIGDLERKMDEMAKTLQNIVKREKDRGQTQLKKVVKAPQPVKMEIENPHSREEQEKVRKAQQKRQVKLKAILNNSQIPNSVSKRIS